MSNGTASQDALEAFVHLTIVMNNVRQGLKDAEGRSMQTLLG